MTSVWTFSDLGFHLPDFGYEFRVSGTGSGGPASGRLEEGGGVLPGDDQRLELVQRPSLRLGFRFSVFGFGFQDSVFGFRFLVFGFRVEGCGLVLMESCFRAWSCDLI